MWLYLNPGDKLPSPNVPCNESKQHRNTRTERNHKPLIKPVSCNLTMTKFTAKYEAGRSKNKEQSIVTSEKNISKQVARSSKSFQLV